MQIKKKKLSVIGTVGLPANYGGFETLADHIVRNLGDDYDITVYCSKKKYSKENRPSKYLNARLKYLPFDANGVQSIIYDSISIIHSLFFADVLLVLGVAGSWILPFVRLFTNKKIIVSVDGIEWKRDKWNLVARMYLWWAEKIAVKYSHIDITDNESIQDYTASRYGSLSRIIEYGADHTLQVKPTLKDKEDFPFIKLPYALKVCRIEPENNVHVVLEAFKRLPKRTMVIIGNWEKSEYGKKLRKKYHCYKNIILLDPIYDQRTLDMIRGNALVYIHGHSAGGTNPSLVEAMFLGLPVIAFNVSYNKTTTERSALYFTKIDELVGIIENTNIDTYKIIGLQMKSIANRRYTWSIIAKKYHYLILESLKPKQKTPVVPLIKVFNQETLLDYNIAHLQHHTLFFERR